MGDNIVYDQMDANASADAWDDEELIKIYDRATAMAHEKIQRKDKSKWKIGDTCMALYADDGKCYSAKIIGFDAAKKKYEVLYTEYDEKAVVSANDLFRPSPSSPLNISANSISSHYHTTDGGSVAAVVGESWRSKSSTSSTSWKRDNELNHSYRSAHFTAVSETAWRRTSDIRRNDGGPREETWKNICSDRVESRGIERQTNIKKDEDWRAIGKSERRDSRHIADSSEPASKRLRTDDEPLRHYSKRYSLNDDYGNTSITTGEICTSEKKNTRLNACSGNQPTGEHVNLTKNMKIATVLPPPPPKYSGSAIQQLIYFSQKAARRYDSDNQLRPISLYEVFDLQAESLLQQMASSCVNSLHRAKAVKKLRFDSITYTESHENRRVCRSLAVTAARLYECEKSESAATLKIYDDGASALKIYFETIREKLGQLPGGGFSSHNNSADLSEDEVEWTDEDGAADSGPSVSVTANGNQETFPIPDLCPPPPPTLFGKVAKAGNNKEALTNMLMSWYMSGYHTGFYQGMQQGSASAKSSNR